MRQNQSAGRHIIWRGGCKVFLPVFENFLKNFLEKRDI
jgi:hypothetical protein